MNVFVTGGGGFLGTALRHKLEEKGARIVAPSSRECDLRRAGCLDRYRESFDAIFHLAAWTQAGDFCLRHPGEQWLINQQINTNVLGWWVAEQQQAKLVMIGTSCAYAPDSHLQESQYLAGEPISSLYTYAMTKRMLYQGARAIRQQFGLNYLCVVPSTLYGPGYHTDGRQMHFIFDLIRKIIRGREYGEQVILWGDGHQRRELVHVDDFVTALLYLAEHCSNDIFNVGAGEELSIRGFAEIICGLVGFPATDIHYDTDRYVGAVSKCLDVRKFRTVAPQLRFRDLRSGLSETVRWFYETRAFDAG